MKTSSNQLLLADSERLFAYNINRRI